MSNLFMFDRFPNDLLYEVFEYLTTYEILYTFRGLNQRIDVLLSKYDQYNLYFQSCPKSRFDLICQSISPEQIRSLILSDAPDTCRQIRLFFEIFYIRRLVNLRSLTLIDSTEQDLTKIIVKLHHLSNLSYLSIKPTHGIVLTTILPSLKSLSIGSCSMHQLEKILLCAPMLTTLDVQLFAVDTSDIAFTSTIPTDIRRLKVTLLEKSNITFDDLTKLFVCMSKLTKLIFIAVKGVRFIHGEQWQHLIQTYLLHLKDFHFKIHPALENFDIPQLLSNFQTPFWLEDKQWFVNCNYHIIPHVRDRNIENVHFYTLPYSDEQFYLSSSTVTLTNVSKDKYQTIKDLYVSIDSPYYSRLPEHFYFSHLHSLTIRNLHQFLPIEKFIDLSQIKHLTIEQKNPIHAEEFFSHVLVHSPQLQSLKLTWYTLVEITRNFTDEQICSVFNKQIKYLHLVTMRPSTDDGKNRISIEILNKIFSTNLEKLSLSVTSIEDISLLLNEMVKLSSVEIEYNPVQITMTNEELAKWLMQNVPRLKNFTHHTRSTTGINVNLMLWIRC